MPHVKIKNMARNGRTIVGTSIEIDGVPITHVKALDLSMGVDPNTLKIEQVVSPEVEIEADVDVTKVCRCCGHPLADAAS